MREDAEPAVASAIVTRSEAAGRWPSAIPLLLLALLGMMLLHTCISP